MVCAISALVSLPILFLYLSNVRFLENRVILVPEVVGGGFMGGGVEFPKLCNSYCGGELLYFGLVFHSYKCVVLSYVGFEDIIFLLVP